MLLIEIYILQCVFVLDLIKIYVVCCVFIVYSPTDASDIYVLAPPAENLGYQNGTCFTPPSPLEYCSSGKKWILTCIKQYQLQQNKVYQQCLIIFLFEKCKKKKKLKKRNVLIIYYNSHNASVRPTMQKANQMAHAQCVSLASEKWRHRCCKSWLVIRNCPTCRQHFKTNSKASLQVYNARLILRKRNLSNFALTAVRFLLFSLCVPRVWVIIP